MCGFVGFVAFVGQEPPHPEWLARMNDTIQHRGPDDDGVVVDGSVGFAFRRLAILDLTSAGHQPMRSPSQNLLMVFNGEIYNYVELREELSALGHRFTSSGDAAVLLAAYQQWGNRCVDHLAGMYAFAIYDAPRGTVFLARDRFGEKPLFLHRSSRGLLFASELKAIRASSLWSGRLHEARFAELLLRQRVDVLPETEETFLADVVQLPAAHWLEISLDGREVQQCYWTLPIETVQPSRDPIEDFSRLFRESMRIRMRADVPVGVMLSGGMDSTSIACEMSRLVGDPGTRSAPLHAFCYEAEEFDEKEQISDTVRETGIVVHRHRPTAQEVWADLPAALWHHDEPLHSPAVLLGYQLYRLASRQGVRVILGGQGADETIGGYSNLFVHMLVSHLLGGRLDRVRSEMRSLGITWPGGERDIARQAINLVRAHLLRGVSSYRRISAQRQLASAPGWSVVEPGFGGMVSPIVRGSGRQDLLSELRREATSAPLPCYLRVEDRNAMAHSVESRLPFLDHALAEYCVALPAQWQMRDGWNKYVLREAMRGKIPESVRARRSKLGFAVPVKSWLRGPLSEMVKGVVLDGPLRTSGWVDARGLERLVSGHLSGTSDHSDALFNMVQISHILTMHAAGWARPSSAVG